MSNIWSGLVREPEVKLEPRYAKVLGMLADGHHNTEIAEALGITIRTVQDYIEQARYAFGGVNKTRAAVLYDRMRRPD